METYEKFQIPAYIDPVTLKQRNDVFDINDNNKGLQFNILYNQKKDLTADPVELDNIIKKVTKDDSIIKTTPYIKDFISNNIEHVFEYYCKIPYGDHARNIITSLGENLDEHEELKNKIKSELDNPKFVKILFKEIETTKNFESFLKELFIYCLKNLENLDFVNVTKLYFNIFASVGYRKGYFRIFSRNFSNDHQIEKAMRKISILDNECFHIFLWNTLVWEIINPKHD